jgi:nucleotide-binding universal stress UspA family protein
MKNILVAIDFSKTSLNVLDYAVRFAAKASANITMVWVDNITNDEMSSEGAATEIRNEKIELFKELQDSYEKKINKVKIDFKTKKGKVYVEICTLARVMNADFIFSGTHGISGFEEFWIGSNAYRIVTHAPCPVISLRLDYTGRQLKNIVMPIDSTQETRQKVPVTTELAAGFDAKVHVLSLYTTKLKSVHKRVDNYAIQAVKYLEDHKVKTVLERFQTDSIAKTTIEYTQRTQSDMISIMTEQETTTANLFLGTYAQQMVYNSPVPIMTMRSRELIEIPDK